MHKKEYISSNIEYSSDGSAYYKNGMEIKDEQGSAIDVNAFKMLIKKEISSFTHKNFNNIIVLIGAGASVVCINGKIDNRFGKTVFMLAELINNALKDDINLYSLQELANLCKYEVPVEIHDNIENM